MTYPPSTLKDYLKAQKPAKKKPSIRKATGMKLSARANSQVPSPDFPVRDWVRACRIEAGAGIRDLNARWSEAGEIHDETIETLEAVVLLCGGGKD